jgi:hypothetical protein
VTAVGEGGLEPEGWGEREGERWIIIESWHFAQNGPRPLARFRGSAVTEASSKVASEWLRDGGTTDGHESTRINAVRL